MRRKVLRLLEEQVAVGHTAVLVIDVQNTFFAEESNLGDKEEKRALVPRLKNFLDGARAAHLPLVFVRMVQTDDDAPRRMRLGRRIPMNSRVSLRPGTWGSELVSEIQSKPNDIFIEKTRFNAFINTPLDARLRRRGITTLVITGAYTNVCVGMTACDGSMRDYYVVIPKDLVVGTDPGLHESALLNFELFFGKVSSAQELLGIWKTVNGSRERRGS